MVSFFGLKLGGDKKKAQNKQPEKKSQSQWDHVDQNTLGQGQYFGNNFNFSRPQIPSSRPGTSSSNRSTSNWRMTFKSPGATSSMVDLSLPTPEHSMGSLRHPASDANLKLRMGNESSSSLAFPQPLGGFGARPGAPERPATSSARTKEWVNPLDVHFCKDTTSSRPGTSQGISLAGSKSSPLGQFEFGIGGGSFGGAKAQDSNHQNGYPSPPQSVENDERALSPSSPVSPGTTPGESRGRNNAAGSLQTGDMGGRPLPSPAASIPRTSEEKLEGPGPVIRNVPARRNTATFHQPRRRSFVMEFDEEQIARQKQREKEREKHQTTQLFAGNFAAFDFGEIAPKLDDSPKVDDGSFKLGDFNIPKKESGNKTSAAPSAANVDASNFRDSRTLGEISNDFPIRPKDTRQKKDAPLHLARIPTPPEHTHPGTLGSPPRLTTDAPRRSVGPPSAAAGAHPGSRATPFESVPQGFRSRMDTDARSRGPPDPLRTAPALLADRQHVDQSPRSPFGPSLALEDNYMRSPEAISSRPGEKTPSTPLKSPLSPLKALSPQKTPTSPHKTLKKEPKAPVPKNLPRGRQPEPPRRPARPDESPVRGTAEGRTSPTLLAWDADRFDKSNPHRSAIPPPLSTSKDSPPKISGSDGWGTTTPTSSQAPRLPSPTFPSLEAGISSSALEIDFDNFTFDQPITSPVLGEFEFPAPDRGLGSLSLNPMRVDASKAPPRPPPITLPPTSDTKDTEVVIKSPLMSPTVASKQGRFQAGFI